MLRLILPVVAFLVICIFLSACGANSKCSVYTNKSKWKYYNSLQYGGGAKKRK